MEQRREEGAARRTTPSRGSKGGAAQAPPTSEETQTTAPPPPPPTGTWAGSSSPGDDWKRARRSGSYTAGIVLIVIGAIVLAGQVIPGLAWWSFWPAVIIIAGLIQALTPGREGWSVARLFDGLVTVAFGLLFLAITLGIVGWNVFWQLLVLWPVLLIAVGLDLLGKALHTSWVRALGSIAVIAALAYAFAVSAGGLTGIALPAGGERGSAELTEPVGDVEEATLRVEAGVAEVTLGSGNDLVDATGESPWGQPDFSAEKDGATAEVRLSLGDADGPNVWRGSTEASIDADLSNEVLWDMVLSTGMSSLDADFSEVKVRSLELKPGVADVSVRLGEVPSAAQEGSVLVEAGVSSVVIEVPEGAAVRIESDSGLTGHDIDADFESLGDGVWQTPDYDGPDDAWNIRVKSGVGSIRIDTY